MAPGMLPLPEQRCGAREEPLAAPAASSPRASRGRLPLTGLCCMLGLAWWEVVALGLAESPDKAFSMLRGHRETGEISRSFSACLNGARGLQRMEAAWPGGV